MEKGYWSKGRRAKPGAYETIDNVTKFALADDDYEDYEEWVEYTPDEIENHKALEEAAAKRAAQDAFLADAPARMESVEECLTALTSAFGEVE